MARRTGYPTYGKQFIGNSDKTEGHDLDNEKTGQNQCQIDEINQAGHAITFTPDTLAQATSDGYDNCAYCLGSSTR